MFIAALFIITRMWKQPKRSSTEEWRKKTWYIYTHNGVLLSSTKKVKKQKKTKKTKFVPFAEMWKCYSLLIEATAVDTLARDSVCT